MDKSSHRLTDYRTRKEKRDKTEKIKDWVQTVAVVLATLWGAYTFMYKEWYLPKMALVNISTDLSLRRIGSSDTPDSKSRRLVAVELSVNATNPSTREVILLPSIWIARGFKLGSLPDRRADFTTQIEEAAKDNRLRPRQKGLVVTDGEPVAAGKLFVDDRLKPSEKIMRKIVFHVQKDLYDYIEVRTTMPTVTKADRLELEWKYYDMQLNAVIYIRCGNKRGRELPRNASGDYMDGGVELQFSKSQAALSLWQEPEMNTTVPDER